jgi:YqjK-like protein
LSSRLEMLRERRLAIVAGCERDREQLAQAFGGIQRELHVADRVIAIARRLSRHRAILGVVAAGLILTPVLARKWVRRASLWLPIAIEGYRIVKSVGGKRHRRRETDSSSE